MSGSFSQKLRAAGWWLKKSLIRRGLAVIRTPDDASLPPSFFQILQSFSDAEKVFSFDDEPQVQRELLGVFAESRVVFASCPSTPARATGFPAPDSFTQPQGQFLVELDAETFDLPNLVEKLPWLCQAKAFFVRCTLGYFFSGRGDACRFEQFFRRHGFEFAEISEYFRIHLFHAPQARVILVFTRIGEAHFTAKRAVENDPVEERSRLRRIHEALAFLSPPLARSSELVRLAGRGSFGYAAGVLNPGAITNGSEIILLARGERVPWVQASRDVSAFLKSCQPLIFTLDQQLAIVRADEAGVANANPSRRMRLEDFRLFRFRDELYSNHSTFSLAGEVTSGDTTPVKFGSSKIGVGISRLDLAARQLSFLGAPALDFPTGPIEKNWAMFDHQSELYLVYSFRPFHLLQAAKWPELQFKTICREDLAIPVAADGLKFRNSANPVDYDAKYFLHMVHKVYPGKKYSFWAVLIEKVSLRPTHISTRPIVCGWQSSPAAIIYACSLVVQKDQILVFGGLNDTGMGFWKVSRTELDANWTVLNRNSQP